MNEPAQMPSLEKVKQTVANSRRCRQELELAYLELEDFILKLEAEKIQRRKEVLSKAFNPFELS